MCQFRLKISVFYDIMMKGRKSVRLDTAHQFNRRIKLTILVIQECMELDMIECKKVWSNTNWYGDHLEFNRSRTGGDLGIGIFSSKYTFSISEFHNTAIRYVVPHKVKIENADIYLFVRRV